MMSKSTNFFAVAAVALMVAVSFVHGAAAPKPIDCQKGLDKMGKDCCLDEPSKIIIFTDEVLIKCSTTDPKKPAKKADPKLVEWVHTYKANSLQEPLKSKFSANQSIILKDKSKTNDTLCKSRVAEFVACVFNETKLSVNGTMNYTAIANFYNTTTLTGKYNMTNFTAMIATNKTFESQFNSSMVNVTCGELKKGAGPRNVTLMPLIIAQLAQAHILSTCPRKTVKLGKACTADLNTTLATCAHTMWTSFTSGAPPFAVQLAKLRNRPMYW